MCVLPLCKTSHKGKSWIASALGVAACNAFFSVRHARLPEMLDELAVDKDEEWIKTKKRCLKCDLLILDDWLLEKTSGKQARELLEIVEGRLRTGSLLICSQFSPAGWHAKLGEGAIADAVIDRIVYRSDFIHIEGDESMRKRIGQLFQASRKNGEGRIGVPRCILSCRIGTYQLIAERCTSESWNRVPNQSQ